MLIYKSPLYKNYKPEYVYDGCPRFERDFFRFLINPFAGISTALHSLQAVKFRPVRG